MTSKIVFNPSSNHWSMPLGRFKERVTREQLREVLLNQSDPIIRGTLCRWRNKHLGAGVYDMWAEQRNK